MTNKSFKVQNIQDYQQIFQSLDQIIDSLQAHKVIVLLNGEVGAGKTTFVREYFKYRKISVQELASPTFSLIHKYQTLGADLRFSEIYHLDLYRLKNEDDLESSGFWDLLAEEKYFIFIEWPDIIPKEWWPKTAKLIDVSLSLSAGERQVTLSSL